ncbi:cupin domain-containing protein [uncultured Umboniibacter sp.]|uniref:cupin domain-containing protein n=1 Tax=uncultured Umboniibacter sp. TaxID=1798917 RepID=UPI00262C4B59|nr:cupin domain-containing protein [uncultured Umboniibacter sp.]
MVASANNVFNSIFSSTELLEDFLSNSYQSKHQRFLATEESLGALHGTLDVATLDELLANAQMPASSIDMARADRRMKRSEFCYDNGTIDLRAVIREYRAGATLILSQLHEADTKLADLCRQFEAVFNCHVQTNIYLTPPGYQGFRPHFDAHDVFVMQVAGSKAWKLYDHPVKLAYKGERFNSNVHKPGELTEEFTMDAGETIYIPKGMMHDASNSGDEPSLHITLGLITKNWTDLVIEAVSEVAVNHPEFRQALPPNFATADFDNSAAQAHFKTLIDIIAKEANLDHALDYFAGDFIQRQKPDIRGGLLDAVFAPAEMKPSQRYQLRANYLAQFFEDGDRLTLVSPGGHMHFELGASDALDEILRGEAFVATDLPGLATEDQRALVDKLAAASVIELAA